MKKIIKSLLIITIIFMPAIEKIYADDDSTPTPIVVNVTASSGTMIYGTTVPTITATYDPSITPATPAVCSTTATNTSPVGSYPTTCSQSTDPNYTFNYTNGSISVTQAAPVINWANPNDITEGTALDTTELNATASVSGTFVYAPNAGKVLSTGTNQTLSVTFIPDDVTNYTTANATTTINVNPTPTESNIYTPLNIKVNVNVPTSCSAIDDKGTTHNYPDDNSPNSHLAVCALETAMKNGSISNVQLTNYTGLGLLVTSINGKANPNSQYWALYQNENYSMTGIALMPVTIGDTITFQLQGFYDPNTLNNLDDQITLDIRSLISNVPNNTSGSGSGFMNTPKSSFDITKAINFLYSQQKTDGSFGDDLYTDWIALSLASNSNNADQKNKLINYTTGEKFSGNSVTDYERHAMALMALGINPYDTNGTNYIKKITDSFDGKQFGDTSKDNDDIFALIVLQNTGFTQNDKMLSSDISFILKKQASDGSWDNSVDLTGASIEALSAFQSDKNVKDSLVKAESYLKKNQKTDGGFGNVSSTAWAIEGILALGEKPTDWKTGDNTPLNYLASNQDADGGIKDINVQNRIWQTSYVLISLSGKTWNNIMQKFPIPLLTNEKITISTKEINNIKNVPASITAKVIATKNTKTSIKLAHKNTKNLATQNMAGVIEAVGNNTDTTQTPKKSWFGKFVSKIFGF